MCTDLFSTGGAKWHVGPRGGEMSNGKSMINKRKAKRVDQEIDDNLRRVYSEAMTDDVPDRFAKLLDQLRAQESGGDADDDGKSDA